MARIASVTVGRNGIEILSRQIAALQRQTAPLAEIIIVDNASSDGTSDLLRQRFPSVTLIPLTQNEGVGGGYAAGLEYAVTRGYDWVWMLDQDSFPTPGTAAELLAAWQRLICRDNVGVIAPVPVDAASGRPYPVFLWRDKQVPINPDDNDAPVSFVDMVISSGSMVRSEALRKAGLPRRDLFIDFVDFEHCLRLRAQGYLIGVVKDCRMYHTIGMPRLVSLLGLRKLWITHPPWRDYYKVRNRVFVVWHEFPSLRAKLFVCEKLLVQAFGTILYDDSKVQRLCLMGRGLRDGIRGRLGVRVPAPPTPL